MAPVALSRRYSLRAISAGKPWLRKSYGSAVLRGTFGMYVREIAPLIGMSEVALEQVFYRARRRGEIPTNWTPNGGRHRDAISR